MKTPIDFKKLFGRDDQLHKVLLIPILFFIAVYLDYIGRVNIFLDAILPESRALSMVPAMFLVVAVVALPMIFMLTSYLNACEKFLERHPKHIYLVLLYCASFFTISSTYWLKANDLDAAVDWVFNESLKDWLDVAIWISIPAIVSYLFFGEFLSHERPYRSLAKAFGGTSVLLWLFFLLSDANSRFSSTFPERFKGVTFNVEAINMAWLTFWSAGILIGYLAALNFHKRVRYILKHSSI